MAMKLKPVDSNASTHLIRCALGGQSDILLCHATPFLFLGCRHDTFCRFFWVTRDTSGPDTDLVAGNPESQKSRIHAKYYGFHSPLIFEALSTGYMKVRPDTRCISTTEDDKCAVVIFMHA